MKKILLLSITSLAMLMADFTLDRQEGKLTPVSETTSPVTEPTPLPPTTAVSGVIPISAARIWYDTYDAGDVTERVAMVNGSWGYFTPEAFQNTFPSPDVNIVNAWYEVFETGNGSSCSPTINAKETNTVVESGKIRMWVLYPEGWVKVDDSFGREGMTMPNAGDAYSVENYKGCPEFEPLRQANPFNTLIGTTSDGHPLSKPAYYWNWHGWGSVHHTLKPGHKAIYVQQYFRKVVQNPALPDDRATSHYVAHVGSDNKLPTGGTIGGEPGTSGFREIGNDWTPVTFLSQGLTKEEFMQNPPPFVNEP